MKKILALFTAMLLLLSSTAVFAEETTTKAGTCEFTGKKMESSFDSTSVAVSVAEMEPGDTVRFAVDINNSSDIDTDWYMSNTVLSSLEDAQSVAENGGYTYILTYTGVDGVVKTIYSSDTVGGDTNEYTAVADMGKGLYEATNSLDEFFFLVTLKPGEKGTVDLQVSLDGESQGNIYQDTLAKLMMNFAVESATTTYTTTPPVKTGDVFMWGSLILITLGLLLVLLGLWKNRKDKKVKAGATVALVLVFALSFFVNPLTAKAAANYSYTVTISAGEQGTFRKLSSISVINQSGKSTDISYSLNNDKTKVTIGGLHYGDIVSCATQSAISVGVDSKYYVKGIRLSGRDNNTVAKSAFTVVEDQDYVVAYGIPGDLTEYTIRYVDTNGVEIADSETYYGNIGDEPVIAYKYIDGYIPTTYNLSIVLDSDVTKNVFDFVYAAAEPIIIQNPNNPNDNQEGNPGNNPAGDQGQGNGNIDNPGQDVNVLNDPQVPLNPNDAPDKPGENESKQLIEDENPPKSANPITYLQERGLLFPIILAIVAVIILGTVVTIVVKSNKKKAESDDDESSKSEKDEESLKE